MHPTRCVAALLACAATGCLSSSYTIDRAELERLANAPPAARVEDLHVKQRTFLSAGVARKQADQVLVEVVQAGSVVRVATLEVARDLAIVRSGVAEIRGIIGEPSHPAASAEPESKVEPDQRARSVGEGPTNAADPAKPSDEEKKREAKEDDATKAIVVGAVILAGVFIGVGLGVAEGQRFDGYVSTEAALPIHLRGPNGEVGWVPLSALTPAMVRGADDALVSDEEGRFIRTKRAPLDRVGFTFDAEVGAGGMNTLERGFAPGFLGRFMLGYFPAQPLGILAGAALGVGPKGPVSVGSEVTPLVEVDVLPLVFRRNHLGLYAEGGRVFGSERLPSLEDRTIGSWMYGGGLLYQRELSTLVALVVRGGVKVFPDPGPAVLAPQLTVGVSVY